VRNRFSGSGGPGFIHHIHSQDVKNTATKSSTGKILLFFITNGA